MSLTPAQQRRPEDILADLRQDLVEVRSEGREAQTALRGDMREMAASIKGEIHELTASVDRLGAGAVQNQKDILEIREARAREAGEKTVDREWRAELRPFLRLCLLALFVLTVQFASQHWADFIKIFFH